MLKFHHKKKLNNVTFKSGGIYTFGYQAWENDPKPVILFIHAYSGNYPTPPHRQWRTLLGINFTYIPRAQRRLFITTWQSIVGNMPEQQRNNIKLTWPNLIARFPYLRRAVRRYFYTPSYYIKRPQEIPFSDWENVVVSTMSKDFSKKVKASLINKFRDVLGRRKSTQKQNKGIFGGRI